MMDKIDLPCIDICTMDRDSGECIGCGRTIEEISNWVSLDNFKKKQILDKLNTRKNNIKTKII